MARLLFISLMPSEYSGASEEVFVNIVRTALKREHKVLFSVPYQNKVHPYIKNLEDLGANIQFRGQYFTKNLIIRTFNKVLRIRNKYSNVPHDWFLNLIRIKKFNPDVLFVNEGMVFQIVNYKDVQFYLDELNIPSFLLNHGHDLHKVYPLGLVKFLREKYVDKFSKIYFISTNALKASQIQLATNIQNATVIKNMCPAYGSGSLTFPPGPLKFAMISRLDAQIKGYHLILEALAADYFRNLSWSLNIYGYGPDEELIKEWIRYFNLTDRVFLKGRVENKELNKVWESHHILLLTSLMEGHPFVLLEAATFGRPALVTPVGDCDIIVKDGITGFVAEGIGVSALRKALKRLFETPHEELALMGRRAAEHVKNFIDPAPWETMLNDILTTAGLPLEGNRS